jgi:hypothetical protein
MQSEEMKNNTATVIAAVQQNWLALEHASEEMKTTRRSSLRRSSRAGSH